MTRTIITASIALAAIILAAAPASAQIIDGWIYNSEGRVTQQASARVEGWTRDSKLVGASYVGPPPRTN